MNIHTKNLSLFLWLLAFGIMHAQPRTEISLKNNWRFTRENAPSAEKAGYNDSYWEKVSIPQSWNARDGQDGGNDYYRGTGWYRTSFKLDKRESGKRVYVRFEGAATVADVFVNGHSVGSHRGNFGAFCFDITPQVSFSSTNLLAVKVNNAKDSAITPLRGDFTIFGGIYRPVHILLINPVSISPLDYASSGIYITPKNITEKSADIHIAAELVNATASSFDGRAVFRVVDGKGKTIASESTAFTLDKNGKSKITGRVSLPNPRLWNGLGNAHLYTLVTEITDGKKVIDRVTESFGVRTYSIDADKGFFLNGKPYRLFGVNKHQDRENMGWAITDKEQEEDFALIREIGATCVRLAHYQHAETAYRLCDTHGFAVWTELSLVDDVDDSPEFLENAKQQLTELIKQNYNHPSIFFWALHNELMPERDSALFNSIIRELNNVAKSLDSPRMTAVASRSKYACDEGINNVADVLGYNVYRGWYEKQPEDFAKFIDDKRAQCPGRKLAITEYGSGAGINQHEYPPKKPQARGQWHPEEWQAYLHEVTWEQISARQYLWGSFIWNMFDFAIDLRSEGELPGRNDKGLVTYDRKTKKDAFYFYKASWNPEAMIYIAMRRFTPRKSAVNDIKIYSNCGEVSVKLNGETLSAPEKRGAVIIWRNVQLKPGMNSIIAEGMKDGKKVKDACEIEYIEQPITENK